MQLHGTAGCLPLITPLNSHMDRMLVADQEELSLTWVKCRVFRVDYLQACSLSW